MAAWLWLSGIVATDGERLFCMKRLLAVNPQNEIALHGISILPTGSHQCNHPLRRPKGERGDLHLSGL